MQKLAASLIVGLGTITALSLFGCPRSPALDASPTSATVSVQASAPPPEVAAHASAPGAPPSPRSTAPTWRGDFCKSNADCGWDDPCVPQRCGTISNRGPVACEKSAPPPGACSCVEDMCTLRRHDPDRGGSDLASCVDDKDCAIDIATATCHPHGQSLIGPIHRQGPFCACRPSMGRCDLLWQEPVACDSWQDCSWVTQPRLRPVPANDVPRPVKRPVRPCKDGEVDSVCEPDGARKTCRIVGWSC